MTLDLKSDTLPLDADESGTIRVAGTRITLDTVIEFYRQGQSANDLARAFPAISLADVHAVIGYYLRHRLAVDAYLAERQGEAASLRQTIEASQHPSISRDELVARRDQHRGRT